LLRPGFVPPRPIRELRDLTRYRKALIRARTGEVNRLHKVLEDAGVKLATVATDVMGVSGRRMRRALIEGVADPRLLAELARARLRAKPPQLRRALTARFRAHHAFLLARMLAQVEALEAGIEVLSERIAELVEPWAGHPRILDSIIGVGPRAAEVILAEIGPDMSRFPTAGHLACGAGRRPGQRESAGKRGSAKPRKGSPWLADVLTECAWAAVKAKGSYLSAFYRQIMRRQGKEKAILAVSHKILVIAWNLLSTGALYDDPGRRRGAQDPARTSNAGARSAGWKRSATRSGSSGKQTPPDGVAGGFPSRSGAGQPGRSTRPAPGFWPWDLSFSASPPAVGRAGVRRRGQGSARRGSTAKRPQVLDADAGRRRLVQGGETRRCVAPGARRGVDRWRTPAPVSRSWTGPSGGAVGHPFAFRHGVLRQDPWWAGSIRGGDHAACTGGHDLHDPHPPHSGGRSR
jgi:transposase